MLRSTPPHAAAMGQEIDNRVQALFAGREGSPSAIGIALMAAMNEIIENTFGHPDHQAIMAAVLYGYWLREYVEREAIPVPSFPLPPGLPLTPAGGFDYDRWGEQSTAVEARMALLDRIWDYGGNDEAFDWMTMPVSNVVFAWAAVFIHAIRPMRGRVAKAMHIERVASCVRAGYAVRSFELAVGEPMLPSFGPRRQRSAATEAHHSPHERYRVRSGAGSSTRRTHPPSNDATH
jgi:hypothetical protein